MSAPVAVRPAVADPAAMASDSARSRLQAVVEAWMDLRAAQRAADEASGDAVVDALLRASLAAGDSFGAALARARELALDRAEPDSAAVRAIGRIARADELCREWFDSSGGVDDSAEVVLDDAISAAADILRLHEPVGEPHVDSGLMLR